MLKALSWFSETFKAAHDPAVFPNRTYSDLRSANIDRAYGNHATFPLAAPQTIGNATWLQ
jgi:hypothetical protein